MQTQKREGKNEKVWKALCSSHIQQNHPSKTALHPNECYNILKSKAIF